MNRFRKTAMLALVCGAITAVAYFAYKFPFFEYAEEIYTTSKDRLFTAEWFSRLMPFVIILALSAIGILAAVTAREKMFRKSASARRFASARSEASGRRLPRQKFSVFMAVRWVSMLLFSFLMIFGGILLGVRYAGVSVPVLSCPVNMSQLAESSCYYLSHLDELFTLKAGDIILFFVSTAGFALLLGRMICGFLCPMGLMQDLMDLIRRRTKTEGITMSARPGPLDDALSDAGTDFHRRQFLQFLSCGHAVSRPCRTAGQPVRERLRDGLCPDRELFQAPLFLHDLPSRLSARSSS